jgi:hypothetical protein
VGADAHRHWFLEHFLGYFVAASIILLGWLRPLLVGGCLAVAAVILEVLQSLSPTHSANAASVLGGASGAIAAAVIAKFITVAWNRRPGATAMKEVPNSRA